MAKQSRQVAVIKRAAREIAAAIANAGFQALTQRID